MKNFLLLEFCGSHSACKQRYILNPKQSLHHNPKPTNARRSSKNCLQRQPHAASPQAVWAVFHEVLSGRFIHATGTDSKFRQCQFLQLWRAELPKLDSGAGSGKTVHLPGAWIIHTRWQANFAWNASVHLHQFSKGHCVATANTLHEMVCVSLAYKLQ